MFCLPVLKKYHCSPSVECMVPGGSWPLSPQIKALAGYMLQDNSATKGATSLVNKTNSINLSSFLSQKNACLITQEKNMDLITKTKNTHNVINAHKTKTITSISRIDTMINMSNLSVLCINMNTVIIAIIMDDVNNLSPPLPPDAPQVNQSSTPTKISGALAMEAICSAYIRVATNSLRRPSITLQTLPWALDVNIIIDSCSRDELNTTAVFKAVKVMKAFINQIDQFQSLSSLITILPGMILKYFTNAFNNSNVCPPVAPKGTSACLRLWVQSAMPTPLIKSGLQPTSITALTSSARVGSARMPTVPLLSLARLPISTRRGFMTSVNGSMRGILWSSKTSPMSSRWLWGARVALVPERKISLDFASH